MLSRGLHNVNQLPVCVCVCVLYTKHLACQGNIIILCGNITSCATPAVVVNDQHLIYGHRIMYINMALAIILAWILNSRSDSLKILFQQTFDLPL